MYLACAVICWNAMPASAFVLAPPAMASVTATSSDAVPTSSSSSAPPPASSDVTTTGGTVDAIPLFSTATNIQNSILTQTGTSAINVGGKLNLPTTGTATSSAGANSRPLDFVASSYNSSTSAAVAETFQWQAQAAGNDTATPSATLNLLFGSGTSTPTQTGLKIASTGLITFATGQTFPGTGKGTITGVTAGTDLTGGGTTGSVTLNLDTTKVPQLAANNTFTGTQTIENTVAVTGSNSAQMLQVTNTATSGATAAISAVGDSTGGYAVLGTSPRVGIYGIKDKPSALGATLGVAGGIWGRHGRSRLLSGERHGGQRPWRVFCQQ